MTIARTVNITVSLADATAVKLLEDLAPTTVTDSHSQYEIVRNFLAACRGGNLASSMQVRVQHAGACATGTLSASGTPSNNDTFTVFGIVFTFKTAPNPDVYHQVAIGSSNVTAMTNLLAALARDPRIQGVASATLATATITLTARVPGKWAEAQGTLVKSGTNLAVSAATLASSTEPTLDGAKTTFAGYTPNSS